MKIGYVRVSTPEQNTNRQNELMKELGVEKVFIDKASGKNTHHSTPFHHTDMYLVGHDHYGINNNVIKRKFMTFC